MRLVVICTKQKKIKNNKASNLKNNNPKVNHTSKLSQNLKNKKNLRTHNQKYQLSEENIDSFHALLSIFL